MRFDLWMMRTYPHIPFERYADKTIGHCKAQRGAATMSALADRVAACKLILQPDPPGSYFPKRGPTPALPAGSNGPAWSKQPPCRLTTPASSAPWPPASGATGRRSASARRAASAPQPLPAR